MHNILHLLMRERIINQTHYLIYNIVVRICMDTNITIVERERFGADSAYRQRAADSQWSTRGARERARG